MPTPKLNLRRDITDKRDFKFSAQPLTLPVEVDYTNQMSPVKDQGYLGSCVGFATSAMKEWQEQKEHDAEVASGKKYRRKEKCYDLSEQWIYYNCKKIDPWPNEEGTSIRCAMTVLNKIGVPTESAWPYDDVVIGEAKQWAPLIARWAQIKTYRRINNLQELKSSLLTNGPLVIGVACFEEIFSPGNKGLVADPRNPNAILGGHAVCVVAYSDKAKIVKFKNSWGDAWGVDGYGRFSYNYINNYMWDAWAAEDHAVTTEMLAGPNPSLL